MNKNIVVFEAYANALAYRKYDSKGNPINGVKRTGYGKEQLKRVKEEINSFTEKCGKGNMECVYQELGFKTDKLRSFLDCSCYAYRSLSPSLAARYKEFNYNRTLPIRMRFDEIVKAYNEYELEELPQQMVEVNDELKKLYDVYNEQSCKLNDLKEQFSIQITQILGDCLNNIQDGKIRDFIPFDDFKYYYKKDLTKNTKAKSIDYMLNCIEDKMAKELNENYTNYFPKTVEHDCLYDYSIVERIYKKLEEIVELQEAINETSITMSKRARFSPYFKEMKKTYLDNEEACSKAIASLGDKLI